MQRQQRDLEGGKISKNEIMSNLWRDRTRKSSCTNTLPPIGGSPQVRYDF
jgi:hypothetical protein